MIVLPVGMHRTGSSMMANILQVLGVEMNGADDKHCEDRDFVRLNRKILRSAGGSWDNPPLRRYIKREAQMWAIDAVSNLLESKDWLYRLAGYTDWGWKDPRMCLLLDKVYQPAFEKVFPDREIRFIKMCRSREHVAASLRARDGKHKPGLPNYGDLYGRYTADLRSYLLKRTEQRVYHVDYLHATHWAKKGRLAIVKGICNFLEIGYNRAQDAYNVIRPQR